MTPKISTGFLFRDIQRRRLALLDELVRPSGLTASQSYLLAELLNEDDQTQTQLAERLGVGVANLGALVDRLCAAGFVERHPDEVDRRIKRVRITEAARPLGRVIARCSHVVNQSTFKGLSEQELARFLETLQRINENLAEVEAAARQKG